jgi:hypothetical protein
VGWRGKTDTFFNGPGDGSRGGHVVESTNPDGSPNCHYVCDVEGNTYRDDRQRQAAPVPRQYPDRTRHRG